MSEETQEQQSLIDHLVELRRRIVVCLWYLLTGFSACWYFSEQIFNFIRAPILPYLKDGLVFTAPMDKFMAHFKVSLLAGAVVTAPLWLHQVWKFIAPGLYVHEKRYALSFIFSGSALFFSGLAFVYYFIFPVTFDFLMKFGGATDTPMITISEYLSFFFSLAIAFGLCFEMPLILVILGMMGVVSAQGLTQFRRYAYVGLAVLAAVATPPDALSMCLMMGPLIFLYEVAVIVVRVMEKAALKRGPEQ